MRPRAVPSAGPQRCIERNRIRSRAVKHHRSPSANQDNPRPASIYDVAKRAGVSIKTVSRVVNHQTNVSEATRVRVMEAVDALSYRPNIFARGLASERSFLIGLLYDNPSASYVAALQLGVLSRCREEGYHLIVESLDARNPNIGRQVHSLVTESALHGVILTPPLCDMNSVIEALKKANVPFVRIAPEKPLSGASDVRIDDHKAAFDMTAYLIGLGHKRIGFIKGHPDHGAALARFEGYRAALAEAGLPLLEELCVQGYFSYQSGMEAGERLLSLKNRPTAIFAANDDMAAAVLAASQRYNLKIPQQLSVAGFDDSLVAQVVWPKLTTCRQPIREMAEAAVAMLIQGPTGDNPVERRLDHELVVRESTVAPPAEAAVSG
jgi:LacI family transcriptional regulator